MQLAKTKDNNVFHNFFKIRAVNLGFKSLILFSFLSINIFNNLEAETNIFNYYILITPVLIFNIIFGTKYFPGFFRLNKKTFGIVFFILIATIFALLKSDISSIKVIFTDFIFIYIIYNIGQNNTISVKFINHLFLVQIFIGIITYYTGQNQYGFFPFQTNSPDFAWRVSIFPYYTPPLTGAFAGLVFLINLINYRKINFILALSLFYLIFSGSRTILLGIAVAFVPLFLEKRIKSPGLRTILPYSIFLFLFLIPLVLPFILNKISNPFFQEFLFRDFYVQKRASFSDVYRVVFIKEYWNAFTENVFLGKGVFDLTTYANLDFEGGDEVRLMNYLATFGIAFWAFLFFLFRYHFVSEKGHQTIKSSLMLYIFVILLFYGTYMRGYHVINQLMFVYLFLNHKT